MGGQLVAHKGWFVHWITYSLDFTARFISEGDYLLWFVKGKNMKREHKNEWINHQEGVPFSPVSVHLECRKMQVRADARNDLFAVT